MNTKHTPGPWKIVDNKTTEQISVFTKSEFEPIAFLNYQKHRGKNDEIEQKANAKLIAAAPDLLEALKELLNIDHNAVDIKSRIDAEHKAKEAINKAL